MDNATRFCAMVEVKQFKRDEQNGLNGNYIGHFFFVLDTLPISKQKNYFHISEGCKSLDFIQDETW